MSALYNLWQSERATQQAAADRVAHQISHGYTGEVELPALLVATWRRSWAERASEAESEGEDIPERESFEEYLQGLLQAFMDEIPHQFVGHNGWGRCCKCERELGHEVHGGY